MDAANSKSCRDHGRCRRAGRAEPPYPRTSSVAATSTARSSAPEVTARASASREAGFPGRQRWASRKRRASRASTGTMRVASAAVSAERNDSRRNARSSSSGSTAAVCSAKQPITISARSPRIPP